MIGLGTIVNVAAIIGGGLAGMVCGRFMKERYQETMIKAMGFAVIVMALGTIISQMLAVEFKSERYAMTGVFSTKGVMMMIVSIAIGALAGEIINIDYWFEHFGVWLKKKTGSESDNRFVEAFVTASLTVSIGAMAVIGSIQDGISADHNTLFAKAFIDMILILMMTAAMGKGCIFSAIPVGVFQGTMTALAGLLTPIMTEQALSNLSLVGNVLILCVGVNIIWPKTIRVANLLPALIPAVIFALI